MGQAAIIFNEQNTWQQHGGGGIEDQRGEGKKENQRKESNKDNNGQGEANQNRELHLKKWSWFSDLLS